MKLHFAQLLSQLGLLTFLVACSTSGQALPSPTLQPIATSAPTSTRIAATTNNSQATPSWQIEFGMSGGFAGLRRAATLSSNGQLIAQDLKTNRQVTVQLPGKELVEIAGLVTQAQPNPTNSRLSNCRDCFQYDVTLQRGNQHFSIQANDMTLESSGIGSLINRLADLQDQALTGKLLP